MKKRAAAVLLCLLLAVLTLLSACKGPEGSDDGTETEPQTTVPATWEDAGVIASGDKTEFVIIRPEDCSEYEKKQASALYAGLKKLCSGITILTDWEKDYASKADEIAQRYEILVGDTNRPQSAAAAQGLAAGTYRVVRDGRKLVVAASSFSALSAGVKALLSSLRSEGDCLIFDGELTGRAADSYLVAVTDQKNSRVAVYDLALGDLSAKAAIWTHTYGEYNIADTRLREYQGKEVVLAAYGGSSASMVDYETGKSLWNTNQTANNPHAAELIPTGGGDVIAVAASTGSEIRFFALPDASPAATVPLEDAHGVLWDPTLNVLWAQGNATLLAFTVQRNGNQVTVTEVPESRVTLPSGGAHDLQPYYGDTDKLLVTNSKSVFLYSKSEKCFADTYGGSNILNRSSVKGVGIFPDGSLVYIYPDGGFKTWTSASLYFISHVDGTYLLNVLKSPDGGYYKVRVWNKNYQ